MFRGPRVSEPFTITVPGPLGANLGQNAHVHWRVKAKATKDARQEWLMAAWSEHLDAPPMDRMRLTFDAYFCRRRPARSPASLYEGGVALGYRPRDIDNLVAAMKPAVDGLVDAGLVEDDDKTRVRYGDHEITWVDSFDDERVEIHVEPLGGKG